MDGEETLFCFFQAAETGNRAPNSDVKGSGALTTTSPRARGVLFVLKGPYDLRVPPIVKISQESESARLTKIILSKSTVKTL